MRPEEDSTGKLTTMKFFGAEIDRVVFFGSATGAGADIFRRLESSTDCIDCRCTAFHNCDVPAVHLPYQSIICRQIPRRKHSAKKPLLILNHNAKYKELLSCLT